MTTANTLIADALGSLGVLGSSGASVNGNDLTLSLRVLNRMLDAWRQQPNMATHAAWVSFTLPANTATRTIGPSGQVDTVRPISLEIGSYSTFGGIDRELRTMERDQYAAIENKALAVTYPEHVYLEAASPLGTLYFWPLAGSAVTVKLAVRSQLATFADLTTDYTLPDGYEAAIVPSLAEKLAPYFERAVPPIVARDAAAGRAAIKRSNAKVPTLDMGERRPSGYSGFLSGQ